MAELAHKTDGYRRKEYCAANDLCLGGVDGLFCGNCGAGLETSEKCEYHNWDDYFDKCEDCGTLLDELPQAMQDEYTRQFNEDSK